MSYNRKLFSLKIKLFYFYSITYKYKCIFIYKYRNKTDLKPETKLAQYKNAL